MRLVGYLDRGVEGMRIGVDSGVKIGAIAYVSWGMDQ